MTAREFTAGPLNSDDIQEKALREGIGELITQCTTKQVEFLHRIHNGAPWKGLDNCPPGKLAETYELLRRTVLKNAAATGSLG